MNISEEIKDFAIEHVKDSLWLTEEEGARDIVKKETIIDNKYRVETLLKMGRRAHPRDDHSLPQTLKEFYADCYYEINIQTIWGYKLSKYTKCIKDFMDANLYHHDLAAQFKGGE